GEGREQRDLVRREAVVAKRVHVEAAEHATVGAQGDTEKAVEPELARGLPVSGVVARVLAYVLHGGGLAGGHRQAAQALADLEARPRDEARRRRGAGTQHEVVALEQAQ